MFVSCRVRDVSTLEPRERPGCRDGCRGVSVHAICIWPVAGVRCPHADVPHEPWRWPPQLTAFATRSRMPRPGSSTLTPRPSRSARSRRGSRGCGLVASDASVVPADFPSGYFPLLVPAELGELAFQVADVIAHEMSVRHSLGEPYGVKLACGKDFIAARLRDQGITIDPTTAWRKVKQLAAAGVFAFVGQLDSWHDADDPVIDSDGKRHAKHGAHVYAPTALVTGERVPGTRSNAPLSCTGKRRWLVTRPNCLRWAVEHSRQMGQRNEIGRWLAWRCTDAGLSENETMRLLTIYRESVPQPCSYTAAEVRATVRSRYRRLRSL